MGADVVTREQMKHSLDDWYRVMLQQNIEKATEMKEGLKVRLVGWTWIRMYCFIMRC